MTTSKDYEQNRDSSGRFTKKLTTSIIPDPIVGPKPIPPRLTTGTTSLYGTRPSSSLSNFEFIDDTPQTHASTPFEHTPSTSPTKILPTEPLSTEPANKEVSSSEDLDSMPNEHVEPFHGDKEDENPEDFLRSFYRRMGTANDDTKK
jgi:hypothetical protein